MKITIEFDSIEDLEYKVKEYINNKKYPAFIWQIEQDILRPPRKHGEDEFIHKCKKEAYKIHDITEIKCEESFNQGCFSAHSVLEDEYYAAKNEHNINDEE